MSAQPNKFRVSPSVLIPLGAEQLNDPALAVLELVKNSWDADATRVTISINANEIKVTDNGLGMSRATFRERWLMIGIPNKRTEKTSPDGRPLIGEKGLGRLATFALGEKLRLTSHAKNKLAFAATVDWSRLMQAESLDDYTVRTEKVTSPIGTSVVVQNMTMKWSAIHTEYLLDHLRFLTSVPNQKFSIKLNDMWDTYSIDSKDSVIEELSQASIKVMIAPDGQPFVSECEVLGDDKSKIVFQSLPKKKIEPSLEGTEIKLLFFLRSAGKKFEDSLSKNRVSSLLQEYAGVRVFLDGINVPPYGLRSNDWAQLEKLRTQTGGPTMTPGNSQIYGEVHLSRSAHPRFVVTAGRAGFSDQQVVSELAEYVQWAVRAIGTARRAAQHQIDEGPVPRRSKTEKLKISKPQELRTQISKQASVAVKEDDSVEGLLRQYEQLFEAHERTDELLRLYAQLASSGIAATSFAHELRADFDVMSSTIRQLIKKKRWDLDLVNAISESWSSIRSFAALFQMMPVRVRRKKMDITSAELTKTAKKVLRLAESQGIKCSVKCELPFNIRIVPAEIDSVMLNLVSNALKAIRESSNRNSGRILIDLSRTGGAMTLSVLDNGCGVSEKVQKIMYRPLEGSFGEGTGMGLPIVQYLVGQYGGVVTNLQPKDPTFVTEFRTEFKRVAKNG